MEVNIIIWVYAGHSPFHCGYIYITYIIIVSLYKGKGVALVWGGIYQGLKLLDQVMKVLERVAENFLRQQVCIDDMKFGFMPGRSTTDVIFIVRQLQ